MVGRTSLRWTYPSGIAIIAPSGALPAFEQGAANDSGTAEVASLDVTLPSPATANRLIVVVGNSDATISTPAGFSVGGSAINAQGLYLFYKVAAGGETAITLTPSVTRPVVGAILEYSGVLSVSPADQNVSATNTGSSTTGPVSAGTTGSTSQASELVVAVTGPHSFPDSATPTSPTWTNSYTNRFTRATTFTTNSRNSAIFVSDLVVSSIGTQTTSTSWTNSAPDWGAIIVTFKGA